MKRKSANDWLDEIAAQISGGPADEIPEGWITLQAVMSHYGWEKSQAKAFCDRAVGEGIMERKKFTMRIPGQGKRPVWHYRPAK
jgi:hypothetical protein